MFNRHLHRAEGLVKHFGRSAAHMELRAMPWHESIIESELAKTKVLINATSIGLTADVSPIPAEVLHDDLLVLDLIYARTRLLRDAEAAGATTAGRRADAAPPGRRGVHAVDRPAGAARAHAGEAGRGPGRRPSLRRGRADRRTGGGRRRVTAFRFLTAGESHGPALGVTIEGVPAGLALTEDAIAVDLARRQKGYGRGARQDDRAGPRRDPRRRPPRP